ncbi:MAG: phosphatidylglycerophosphatase A [Ignavibacteriales bacterium]|nr:phosphatidylglycerophosphatase A [Ignavibacteriales bacterium]
MSIPPGSPSRAESALVADPSFHVPLPARIFASGLFTGYVPFASGTFGSLAALGLYLIPGFEHPYVIMPACAVVLLLGAKAAGLMERRYGHDPAQVTIDEVLGMWISLFLVPKSLSAAVVAFFIFRILDIIKPWPARKFDSLRGGMGIMMDDVVAGVYTNLLVHLIVRLGLHTILPL